MKYLLRLHWNIQYCGLNRQKSTADTRFFFFFAENTMSSQH